MASTFTYGTKVRTLYEHSETATVVKPRKGESLPSTGWHIVQFDDDEYGKCGRLCVHREMLALSNQSPA